MRETGACSGGDAVARGGHSESADILLRLEQNDVDLGSEEAAQHHRPTQTDRDAHGGGLHLEEPDVRPSLSGTASCTCMLVSGLTELSCKISAFVGRRVSEWEFENNQNVSDELFSGGTLQALG